jgi:ABC-type multidrug transport system ATPase subunit
MSGQMSTSSGCCGSTATTTMDEEGGSLVANQGDGGLIASILDEVGLSAQKDTVVGGMFKRGLSGGQKRRLSVALEAITSPLNMFLDEPTSGLDSESALRLMQYLHRYARGIDPTTGERRRVIVTIHQPSSRIWELIGMCSILSFVAFLLLISIHGQFI